MSSRSFGVFVVLDKSGKGMAGVDFGMGMLRVKGDGGDGVDECGV
jgi:hypothetical protein